MSGQAERPGAPASRNEVVLVGRVSAPPEERELPSGDRIVTWRLVVDRPLPRRAAPDGVRPTTVDTLDCVTWPAGVRRTVRGFAAGDVVAVEGALHRRFWRAGAAAASRSEVEVTSARRLWRPSPAEQPSRPVRRRGGPGAPAPSAASG